MFDEDHPSEETPNLIFPEGFDLPIDYEEPSNG